MVEVVPVHPVHVRLRRDPVADHKRYGAFPQHRAVLQAKGAVWKNTAVARQEHLLRQLFGGVFIKDKWKLTRGRQQGQGHLEGEGDKSELGTKSVRGDFYGCGSDPVSARAKT